MRENLFRGKRTDNGEWVYGFYFHSLTTSGKIAHCIQTIGKIGFLDVCYDVLPETVGQYTELTDKNGTKIFEDDILCEPDVMHNGKIQIPGEIARVAMDEGCYFVLYEGYTQFLSNVCNKWDVIGNIHDNPELIGGVGDG